MREGKRREEGQGEKGERGRERGREEGRKREGEREMERDTSGRKGVEGRGEKGRVWKRGEGKSVVEGRREECGRGERDRRQCEGGKRKECRNSHCSWSRY